MGGDPACSSLAASSPPQEPETPPFPVGVHASPSRLRATRRQMLCTSGAKGGSWHRMWSSVRSRTRRRLSCGLWADASRTLSREIRKAEHVACAMAFCSLELTWRRLWKNMEASDTTGLLRGHWLAGQTKHGQQQQMVGKRGGEENSLPGRTTRTNSPSADLGRLWRAAIGKGRDGDNGGVLPASPSFVYTQKTSPMTAAYAAMEFPL